MLTPDEFLTARWAEAGVTGDALAVRQRILAAHQPDPCPACGDGFDDPTRTGTVLVPCPRRRVLLAAFREHPDFDPAWG